MAAVIAAYVGVILDPNRWPIGIATMLLAITITVIDMAVKNDNRN